MTRQSKQRITGDVVVLIAGGLMVLGLVYIGAL
jgi:hypothetical protein